jgi:hypothetical protein
LISRLVNSSVTHRNRDGADTDTDCNRDHRELGTVFLTFSFKKLNSYYTIVDTGDLLVSTSERLSSHRAYCLQPQTNKSEALIPTA